MNSVMVTVTDTIMADQETIYKVIADYQKGHQAILPRPEFQAMDVLEGGYGAGTRIRIHIKVLGQSYYYEQVVEEPDAGRVLVERDIHTGQTSTFILEALGKQQTQVTIQAVQPLSKGFKGFLERISQPAIMKRLFQRELKQLAEYVGQVEAVS